MKTTGRKTLGFTIAAAVLVIDQITKNLSLGLSEKPAIELLGGFIRLVLQFNRGAAFSLSWGGPVFLTILSGVAVVFVAVMLFKNSYPGKINSIALGAVLGGALGNLLDRFFYGAVIDFISIGTNSYRWPTFNFADMAISAGGVILIFMFRSTKKRKTGDVDGSRISQ